MTLRAKTWIVVLTAITVMVGVLLFIGGRALLDGFQGIEDANALTDSRRVLAVVAGQRDAIERTARDYAEWTATVAYATGDMPAFPEENWTASSLRNLKVDTMLVFDGNGRPVGGAQLSGPQDEAAAAPAALFAAFAADATTVVRDASSETRIKGFRNVDSTPWLYACVPVFDPDSPGSPRGALVVGRKLDAVFLAELAEITAYPLTLHRSAPEHGPEGEDVLFTRSGDTMIYFAEPVADHLDVHLGLEQTDGSLFGTIHFTLDRPIHRQAVRTAWLIVLQAAGVTLLCGVLFSALLSRAVVSRLEDMHGTVQHVGAKDDLNVRIAVRGNDEIAGLGRAINSMLDALARGRAERETAQKERERLQEQLLQSQKMEAIGDFAGGIAHDFNNCLTTITGWLSLVREDLPEEHEHRESLGLALESARHASAVVKQLLVYSRPGTPTLTAVSMRALLGSSLQLLRSALPRSIDLHFSTTGDDDVVLGDATQLQQVVLNLVKNAADAIESSGRISIGLAGISLPAGHAAGTGGLAPGRYVHLSVKDSGTGISPALIDHIFEPFFTTKSAGKGTGLGLAVVRNVVMRHRGSVGVTSPPGEGAIFHVYLPLHLAEPRSTVPDKSRPDPHGCRILVVDDDPGVRSVIVRLVSSQGYTVVPATDGLDAWEKFSEAEPPFEIVLTDLTMPRLGGMQLGERIFNSGRRAPVLLMTAYATTFSEEQLRRAGFAALLPKPLDLESLQQALARARSSN